MILVMTGNEDLYFSVASALETRGFRATWASTPSVGTARVLLDAPELVICDAALAGREKAVVTAERRSIPVLFVEAEAEVVADEAVRRLAGRGGSWSTSRT